jgi:type VI secretion system protein ImpJ
LITQTFALPELIEWHEGMLLTPQHFQQLSARSELLTHFMRSQSGCFAWGVLSLKFDETALGAGVVRILNVEAIMPDGMLALGGSERGIDLEFDLQKAVGDPTRVYLAVPREAALYTRTDYSRYDSVAAKDELTPDDISDADSVSIPRIRARFRLLAGESGLSGMITLPLIEFGRQGTVCKPTRFIAPFLRMEPGSRLANLCAPVRKTVREKATELATKLSPSAKNTDLAGLHQLQWLVSGLPLLEALLESNQTHPYSLYLALCSMAGSVAFLSNARVPPIFSPYNHNDLLASFEEVIGFIRMAISQGLIDNWLGKEFDLTQVAGGVGVEAGKRRYDRSFEISPSLEKAFGDTADFSAPFFGLMLRAPVGVSPNALVEWGESCLLATEDVIPDLEMSRSRGAICENVDSFDDLVPAAGSVLFRVKNDPRWFDPRKMLVLKAAKQETRAPEVATLFIRERSGQAKDLKK